MPIERMVGHFARFSPEIKGKAAGGSEGGAAHHRHRGGAVLQRGPHLAQHPAVLPAGRGDDCAGHDVLYPGCRVQHDARSRNLAVIIGMGFLLGFLITISEPDLQVLAGQVPAVPNMVLILAVAAGVGLFLVLALLRMLFGVPLAPMLVFFYMIVFVLALFVPKDFLAVAFDPGGVTTGPMTATFLLPFAQGACAAVGGNIVTDAFGVVAMVAMTPLIAIQILGMVYQARQRSAAMSQPIPAGAAFEALDDDAIIEL